MKVKLLLAFGIAAAATVASGSASAFCVYNNIKENPKSVTVELVNSGFKGNYRAEIKPGQKSCCNWKEKTCNTKKKQDSMLDFEAQIEIQNGFGGERNYYCGKAKYDVVGGSDIEAKIQAGGYWTFEDNPRFDKNKKRSSDNPPYVLKSWSHDHKPLATYMCPLKYNGKPGLIDVIG